MKREILSFSDARRLRQKPEFAFLAAVLLCGVLAGSLTGLRIPQTEDDCYAAELAQLLCTNAAGQLPTARTTVLCFVGTFCWAAALVLLGKLFGRLLFVSLLIAVRGFFLAFAAAAALTASGYWGIYLSFVSIGVSAALWIPALLLLGTAVLDVGRQRGYLTALARHGTVLALCVLLLTLSVIWRLLAVPALLGLGA